MPFFGTAIIIIYQLYSGKNVEGKEELNVLIK